MKQTIWGDGMGDFIIKKSGEKSHPSIGQSALNPNCLNEFLWRANVQGFLLIEL